MRKICVVHLFSSKRALSFRSIREDEVSLMIEKISKSASSTELTNLSETLMLLTNTIICRIAFGKRYGDDEGCERSRFHGVLNEIEAMAAGFFFTDYFPFMGWWVDKFTGMIGRLCGHRRPGPSSIIQLAGPRALLGPSPIASRPRNSRGTSHPGCLVTPPGRYSFRMPRHPGTPPRCCSSRVPCLPDTSPGHCLSRTPYLLDDRQLHQTKLLNHFFII